MRGPEFFVAKADVRSLSSLLAASHVCVLEHEA